MGNTCSLLYYIKRSKKNEEGKAPIYLRLTIDGRRAEISLKYAVEPKRWNSEAAKVRGTTEEARNINSYMEIVRNKIYEHHRKLIESNKLVTAEALKNSYLGLGVSQRLLLEVFEYHNSRIKALVGKEYAVATYKRYSTTLKLVREFIKWKYKKSDYFLNELDHQFVTEFEFYLQTVRNNNHNTTIKYIKNLKKVIRIAISNNWINRDPFINFKVKLNEVEPRYISQEEIQAILDADLPTKKLNQVRDTFIFCCYTGLAYVDLKKLAPEHVVIGIDGLRWLQINRTKTEVKSIIPLLPIAEGIIDKYANTIQIKGKLLPVLSNQKQNRYLKDIARLCNIKKNLTMHVARFSFATSVTLTNNVPIESVSAMLGHKSLRTTAHYAKVVNRKLSDDMRVLRDKLKPKESERAIVPK